jgi:hypothetical protein
MEKLHDVELHNLYSKQNIIRVIEENEMGGECSAHGGDEKCVQNFG